MFLRSIWISVWACVVSDFASCISRRSTAEEWLWICRTLASEQHLISDSYYVSGSSPRGSIMANFHCSISLLSPAACLPSVLCSLFECAASFLCTADAAVTCWQRKWSLTLTVTSRWHARPRSSPSQGLCHMLWSPQNQRLYSVYMQLFYIYFMIRVGECISYNHQVPGVIFFISQTLLWKMDSRGATQRLRM